MNRNSEEKRRAKKKRGLKLNSRRVGKLAKTVLCES